MCYKNNVITLYPSSDRPADAASLPALSDADRAAIATSTDAAIRRLLAEDALAPATRRSYAGALRYWADWHAAAFGTPLPLLARQPVPAETIAGFIAHHLPDGEAQPPRAGMPSAVRTRLESLIQLHRRRSARQDGDPHLMALATLRHRLSSLQAIHRMLGLPVAWQDDSRVRLALRAAPRRVARTAPALLRTPKAPLLRADVLRMLDACAEDGVRGARDIALLWLAFGTGGRRRSELAGLRWEHLRPNPEGEGATWHLAAAKGRVADSSAGVMRIPVVGSAWAAVLRWRAEVLRQAPALAERGPVLRRLLPDGTLLDEPLTGHDVWRIVRQRAASLGLDPDTVGAHSLRSGAATSFLLEGGALADASAMLGHRRLDTTRQHYDRRGVPLDAVRRLAGPALPGDAA